MEREGKKTYVTRSSTVLIDRGRETRRREREGKEGIEVRPSVLPPARQLGLRLAPPLLEIRRILLLRELMTHVALGSSQSSSSRRSSESSRSSSVLLLRRAGSGDVSDSSARVALSGLGGSRVRA